MQQRRHETAIAATLTGLVDQVRARGATLPLCDDHRLDGRAALITGANRGLGRAIAVELARRGATVYLACRSDLQRAAHEVRRLSAASGVDVLGVDLADLQSVVALADVLAARGVELDVTVLNAAVVPSSYRETRQGHEIMFGVNYLAHALLVRRLLARGVIRPAPARRPPCVVAISSDSHRSAPGFDPAFLQRVRTYGMTGVMPQYEHSKLLLQSFCGELARGREGRLAVHSVCPGAVDTGIARESPRWVKPVLVPVMRLLFQSPARAALPAVYLACAPELRRTTGRYFHMRTEKRPDPRADDPALADAIRLSTDHLLAPYR